MSTSVLRTCEGIAKQLLDLAPDALVLVDQENRIVVWNRAAAKLFSVVSEDAVGRSLVELFWGTAQAPVWLARVFHIRDRHGSGQTSGRAPSSGTVPQAALSDDGETISVQTIRTSIPNPGRSIVESQDDPSIGQSNAADEEFQVEISSVIGRDGTHPWVAFFIRDIGPQTRRLNELERASITDEVSQLVNRRGFQQQLESHAGADIGLAIIDVDHFKAINDQYGHHYGDLAIQFVAGLLRDHFDEAICVARLGGDEFGVIFSFRQEDAIRLTFEKFRSSFELGHFADEQLQLTVSIGIALSTRATITAREMLIAADEALYESKRAGRNQVTIRNC